MPASTTALLKGHSTSPIFVIENPEQSYNKINEVSYLSTTTESFPNFFIHFKERSLSIMMEENHLSVFCFECLR